MCGASTFDAPSSTAVGTSFSFISLPDDCFSPIGIVEADVLSRMDDVGGGSAKGFTSVSKGGRFPCAFISVGDGLFGPCLSSTALANTAPYSLCNTLAPNTEVVKASRILMKL